MKKYFCILSIIVLVQNVLGQDSATVSSFARFPQEIKPDLKPAFEIRKRTVRDIFFADSIFYFRNKNEAAGYYITPYSPQGKKRGKEYVQQGGGVNQIAAGMSAGFWNNRLIWIHDIMIDKIVIADGFDKASTEESVRLSEYKLPLGFYWIGMIDSNLIVGAGVDDSPVKIQELELSTGRVIKSYGAFSAPPANIPFNSWKMAYQSFLYVKPGGDVVALACRFTDKVEFFNRKNGSDKIVNGPDNFDVVFNPIQTGNFWAMERVDETRFAFVNGMATSKYLYLLYAGHQHEDPKGDSGRYIFVYNWDGDPVKKITLGTYVSTFTVTPDDKNLYCDNGTGMMLRGELE